MINFILGLGIGSVVGVLVLAFFIGSTKGE